MCIVPNLTTQLFAVESLINQMGTIYEDISYDSPAISDPELPYDDADSMRRALMEFHKYVDDIESVASLHFGYQDPFNFYDWEFVNDEIIPLPFLPKTRQHVTALTKVWFWNIIDKANEELEMDIDGFC